MTTDTTCDLCGEPVRDTAYVCPRCTANTARYLRDVITAAAEVETTVARLARYSDRHGRAQPEEWEPGEVKMPGGLRPTPLPFDPGARQRGDRASSDIVTWARHVAETRGVYPSMPGPAFGPLCGSQGACRHESCSVIWGKRVPHPVARAAAFLLGHLEWLRYRQEAEEAMTVLAAAGATIVRIVDAPPALWYAGPCWAEKLTDQYAPTGRCEEELYARTDDGTVKCPACKAWHDVRERRVWLLGEADDVLAHAALIAGALTVLDRPVTSSMVRNYADRGRIQARGVDERGRPLYRVGDVRQVVAEVARRTTGVAA
ncbi:hypothetical protein ACFOOK_28180 [Micromonospora krabiensis]|uniref:Uncharacterized protein n=1 Tax=Micromonospora krabiensis TaxID=307121 RepID=A0A1C3N4R1_9ACTN|nr:hypothetical protein [Micromonospora krabiensis]SBV27553.1 hypothetical protein GA0070620_3077 [Micromonospora krabiensis]